MQRLEPGWWLSNEIMDAAMELMRTRDAAYEQEGRQAPRCHFFNANFFTQCALREHAHAPA